MIVDCSQKVLKLFQNSNMHLMLSSVRKDGIIFWDQQEPPEKCFALATHNRRVTTHDEEFWLSLFGKVIQKKHETPLAMIRHLSM